MVTGPCHGPHDSEGSLPAASCYMLFCSSWVSPYMVSLYVRERHIYIYAFPPFPVFSSCVNSSQSPFSELPQWFSTWLTVRLKLKLSNAWCSHLLSQSVVSLWSQQEIGRWLPKESMATAFPKFTGQTASI